MKASSLSRAITITDNRAAILLVDPAIRRVLLALVGKALSVGQLAQASGMDLKRMHYRVTRLARAGLVICVGSRSRAGRPAKLYTAAAPAFYLPHDAAPNLYSDKLAQELRGSLHRAARREGGGVLFTVDESGAPLARAINVSRQRDAVEMWRILKLSRTKASELADELEALLDRYGNVSTAGGSYYLVHAAVVVRIDETVTADNG